MQMTRIISNNDRDKTTKPVNNHSKIASLKMTKQDEKVARATKDHEQPVEKSASAGQPAPMPAQAQQATQAQQRQPPPASSNQRDRKRSRAEADQRQQKQQVITVELKVRQRRSAQSADQQQHQQSGSTKAAAPQNNNYNNNNNSISHSTTTTTSVIDNPQQQQQRQQAQNDTNGKLQQQRPNICAACSKPIRERYLLMALDKPWHEDCLKCACCDCRLGEVGSSLFTHSDKLLCRRDFLRIFGQHGSCAACARTIPPYEMVMRANELAYHMDCFACQQCQYRFCVGDRYHLTETHKIICLLCYSEQQQQQTQQHAAAVPSNGRQQDNSSGSPQQQQQTQIQVQKISLIPQTKQNQQQAHQQQDTPPPPPLDSSDPHDDTPPSQCDYEPEIEPAAEAAACEPNDTRRQQVIADDEQVRALTTTGQDFVELKPNRSQQQLDKKRPIAQPASHQKSSGGGGAAPCPLASTNGGHHERACVV